MTDSFDHFTTGRFTWKVIKIHSIQSMCELINDLSRLSWGAAHPKHLPAVHSGDSHSSSSTLHTEAELQPRKWELQGILHSCRDILSQGLKICQQHPETKLTQEIRARWSLCGPHSIAEPYSISTWKQRGASFKWWLWSQFFVWTHSSLGKTTLCTPILLLRVTEGYRTDIPTQEFTQRAPAEQLQQTEQGEPSAAHISPPNKHNNFILIAVILKAVIELI